MSQPPKNRPPTRAVRGVSSDQSTPQPSASQQRASAGRSSAPTRSAGARNAPPSRRDPFPFIIGGVVGLLVVALLAIAYLLATGNKNGPATTANNIPGGTSLPAAVGSQTVLTPQPTVAPENMVPPRITMADFKALYDDPSKRPLIIDVRNSPFYDAGHITGSINIPQSDVPVALAKIPKDKLVVAYCQ